MGVGSCNPGIFLVEAVINKCIDDQTILCCGCVGHGDNRGLSPGLRLSVTRGDGAVLAEKTMIREARKKTRKI